MRTAHSHRFTGNTRTNPTRLWIQTLLVLLGALAALVIVLVVTIFQPLVTLFSPLINVLRVLTHWFPGFLKYTFSPNCLYQPCPIPSGPDFYFSSPPDLPSTLTQMIRAVGMNLLGFFVLVILFWIVWRVLHGRKGNQNEDEVREWLPVRITLKTRQRNAKGQKLETLDATSARAHYRAFLLAIARRGEEEQRRRPAETPAEYQTRLLAKTRPATQKNDAPTDATILETLTHAYTRERYGGKPPTVSQQAYLRRWISLLVRRLTSS
jgi:hypothetical protein